MSINKVIVNGETKIDLTTGHLPVEFSNLSWCDEAGGFGSFNGQITFRLPRVAKLNQFPYDESWSSNVEHCYYWPKELVDISSMSYRSWHSETSEGPPRRTFVIEDNNFYFTIENAGWFDSNAIEGIIYNGTPLTTVKIPEGICNIQGYMLCNWVADEQLVVILPSTTTRIYCNVVRYYGQENNMVVIKATTPPSLEYSFYPTKIMVPTESLELYKSATNWSDLAERIVGGAENYDS